MSWLFLRALVEAYSADIYLDGEPSALLRSNPTLQAFSSPGRTTVASRLSQYGMTSEPLTEDLGAAVLTSFLEDFHVKTSAPQDEAPGYPDLGAGFGRRWLGLLAKYDPATSTWRTPQSSLVEGLDEFSETWPRWGSMRTGECWERDTLAHATDAIESGFVPTVLTSKATGPGLHGNGSHNFRTWFRENSTARRLPLHGELMMIWPPRWASVGVPLEMDKFQQWQQQHGES